MKEHNIKLTSSEFGSLWSSYMQESSNLPVLKYFDKIVEDTEVKSILEKAMNISKKHLLQLEEIFKEENYPVPIGFSDNDVNLDAPRLYSDTYILYYLRNFGKAGIAANGLAISFSAREDIRKLYKEYLNQAVEIEDKSKSIMLSKGLYIRAPYIDIPEEPTFVQKQSFLRGWFGERRTLTAQEISHIYLNFTNSVYARALVIGFSQVAKSEELRNFFIRGTELSRKIINELLLILEESSLPSPMTWDTEVTNSTISPFSDKLMLFIVSTVSATGLANSGGSLALSFRKDIAAQYIKQLKDIGLYAEDAANIMIKNGWFERPPQAIDREYLAKEKNK